MPENRETSRDKLASLLEAELVTSLAIVHTVYNRKVDDPGGRSPIVCVLSAGADRQPSTFSHNAATFYYEIQIWVLYADPTASPAWTEALAEDRLDLIEKEVGEVIEDNHALDGFWDAIEYAGRSTVADVSVLGGAAYVLEKIPVMVEIY